MSITITCHFCQGSGTIPLTGIYADTLHLLQIQKRELSAADLARIDGCCKATTMNNRLAALEKLGLLSSRRYGRQRLFSLLP